MPVTKAKRRAAVPIYAREGVIETGLALLKVARDQLRAAGSKQAADYVARAMKSAEGAKRHANRMDPHRFAGRDHRAFAEGWGLFESGTYGWEIEADQESPIFCRAGVYYDEEAVAFLKAQAAAGSDYHKAALARVCGLQAGEAFDEILGRESVRIAAMRAGVFNPLDTSDLKRPARG